MDLGKSINLMEKRKGHPIIYWTIIFTNFIFLELLYYGK